MCSSTTPPQARSGRRGRDTPPTAGTAAGTGRTFAHRPALQQRACWLAGSGCPRRAVPSRRLCSERQAQCARHALRAVLTRPVCPLPLPLRRQDWHIHGGRRRRQRHHFLRAAPAGCRRRHDRRLGVRCARYAALCQPCCAVPGCTVRPRLCQAALCHSALLRRVPAAFASCAARCSRDLLAAVLPCAATAARRPPRPARCPAGDNLADSGSGSALNKDEIHFSARWAGGWVGEWVGGRAGGCRGGWVVRPQLATSGWADY